MFLCLNTNVQRMRITNLQHPLNTSTYFTPSLPTLTDGRAAGRVCRNTSAFRTFLPPPLEPAAEQAVVGCCGRRALQQQSHGSGSQAMICPFSYPASSGVLLVLSIDTECAHTTLDREAAKGGGVEEEEEQQPVFNEAWCIDSLW